jgi:hypothetical protein
MNSHGANPQYGRRIECDGSWTIYHVFSGVPAIIRGRHLTSLTRAAASAELATLTKANIDAQFA